MGFTLEATITVKCSQCKREHRVHFNEPLVDFIPEDIAEFTEICLDKAKWQQVSEDVWECERHREAK